MFGSLDCSSTHFCPDMLAVGITGADLSMVTALPTYASTTACDIVTVFATTFSQLITQSIGTMDKASAFAFDLPDL